ncbi:hypothetical protein, partial [Aurantimonas sp. C2-4-R8]|nr:hypothetical protein [Aurantimonas sp. C2-4-R8]
IPHLRKGAHDHLKSLLTIPRNLCSRCGEIRAHDAVKYANRYRKISRTRRMVILSAGIWFPSPDKPKKRT